MQQKESGLCCSQSSRETPGDLHFLCCETLTYPPRSHGLSRDWHALINCIEKRCSPAEVCSRFALIHRFPSPLWQIKASDFPKMNLYASNVNVHAYERSPVISASLIWGSRPQSSEGHVGKEKQRWDVYSARGFIRDCPRAGRFKGNSLMEIDRKVQLSESGGIWGTNSPS